ncbi:MAG: beta-propeller domain-containing protein [bacterium]
MKKILYSLGGATVAVLAIVLVCFLYLSFSNFVPTPGASNKYVPGVKNMTVKEQLANQDKMLKFSDYTAAINYMRDNYTENKGGYYGSNMLGMGGMGVQEGIGGSAMVKSITAPTAISSQMPDSSVGLGSSEGGIDYSQTNVQVQGVDEADIIKTDGKFIYALVGKDLYLIKANPASSSEIISKISFKDRPLNIYIDNDRLAVFGYEDLVALKEYSHFRRRNPFTFFKIFDISDPKNPKLERTFDIEGNYKNSRMIGDYVYLVTDSYDYYYIEGEPISPRLIEDGKELANSCVGNAKCFAPDIYYFDIPYDNYNLTTITAINISDKTAGVTGESYILSGNEDMYVSPNNIYITYTKNISEYQLLMEVMQEVVVPLLSSTEQQRIKAIEGVQNYVLSRNEKMQKINQIIERYLATLSIAKVDEIEKQAELKLKSKYKDISKELEKTVVHKIAIDKGKLEYKTSGSVTGKVLNQFSMDEDANGYFRIATTKNQTWSYLEDINTESYNNLYVLGSDLKIIGKLEGFASTERIYSVRFMQDRAYLVTFKNIDPLFVIDLKDPAKPAILGQLKIPGYSDYLHPYDNTTLIGVGKETETNEWGGVTTLGVKISLFDVSEVSNPTQLSSYSFGGRGSDTIVSYDHKAFLFSLDKNLMVIPVTLRHDSASTGWGKLAFRGAAVFSIDKTNGIKLQNKLDHSDGIDSSPDYLYGSVYYDSSVKRSLYIDDSLYTFSDKYLMMNKLSDLSLIKKMELKKTKAGSPDDYEIIN